VQTAAQVPHEVQAPETGNVLSGSFALLENGRQDTIVIRQDTEPGGTRAPPEVRLAISEKACISSGRGTISFFGCQNPADKKNQVEEEHASGIFNQMTSAGDVPGCLFCPDHHRGKREEIRISLFLIGIRHWLPRARIAEYDVCPKPYLIKYVRGNSSIDPPRPGKTLMTRQGISGC
jgi:hypothetical protein